jgi:hypothetical protein
MSERGLSRLAWVALGGIVLVVLTLLGLSVAAGDRVDPFGLVMMSFPVVGALIASRQSRNSIGWVMLAVGLVAALDGILIFYADYALIHNPGSLPRPDLALALSAPMWVPLIGLMGTFVILLFPDGHLPTPRWRWWAWLCGIALILSYVVILVGPGSFEDVGHPDIRNPLGIESLRPIGGALLMVIVLIPVSIVGCAFGLIQRFRRSRGEERLQLKWLAAAAGTTAALYLMAMVGSIASGSVWAGSDPIWLVILQNVAAFSFALIPMAVGIAILKYRLYDIDLIINRALVYGALSAALTAAYFLAVTAFQGLLQPFGGQSQLAVAGSTLLIAALFRPGRARVQSFIDRRFYRRRYDSARTLERFSAKLRNEVDLNSLTGELVALTVEVMQPTHVSLWLTPTRSEEKG